MKTQEKDQTVSHLFLMNEVDNSRKTLSLSMLSESSRLHITNSSEFINQSSQLLFSLACSTIFGHVRGGSHFVGRITKWAAEKLIPKLMVDFIYERNPDKFPFLILQ